jgi:hypothetical protein
MSISMTYAGDPDEARMEGEGEGQHPCTHDLRR